MTMIDPIIAFYLDSAKIKEQIGFTYNDVMKFNDDELEACHNYIQWLFPLKEASQFNPDAPLVTEETLEQFKEFYDIVGERMYAAFRKMFTFYFNSGRGFWLWVTPNNHNFLRITRILKSQNIFGYDFNVGLMSSYLENLTVNEEYNEIIGPVTRKFWIEATNS